MSDAEYFSIVISLLGFFVVFMIFLGVWHCMKKDDIGAV